MTGSNAMSEHNTSLAGRVAFVTGAANGIGRATALAFAREGAAVAVADASEQANQETARMIEAADGRALAIRCDVTQAEAVKAALNKTIGAFGRLDFAFNNAGVEQPPAGSRSHGRRLGPDHRRRPPGRLPAHEA